MRALGLALLVLFFLGGLGFLPGGGDGVADGDGVGLGLLRLWPLPVFWEVQSLQLPTILYVLQKKQNWDRLR